MRIAVLGGTGRIGRATVEACTRVPDAEVTAVSRSGELALDLTDPAAPAALDPFDLVIDAADTARIDPVPLARRVLEQGGVFLETSADAKAVERLLALRAVPEPRGTVVLCGGLFPGLSQLLAAEVLADGPPAQRIEVAVRYRPWAGAGGGTVRLMASALGRRSIRYEAGVRVEEPPVLPGPRIAFPTASAATLRVGLAEGILLGVDRPRVSTGALLAARPGSPGWLQDAVARATPWGLFRNSLIRGATGAGTGLVRRALLSGVVTPVEVVAIADRRTEHERSRALRVDDGMTAVAVAAAATAAVLLERPPEPGVRTIDAVSGLDETLDRVPGLITTGSGCAIERVGP